MKCVLMSLILVCAADACFAEVKVASWDDAIAKAESIAFPTTTIADELRVETLHEVAKYAESHLASYEKSMEPSEWQRRSIVVRRGLFGCRRVTIWCRVKVPQSGDEPADAPSAIVERANLLAAKLGKVRRKTEKVTPGELKEIARQVYSLVVIGKDPFQVGKIK